MTTARSVIFVLGLLVAVGCGDGVGNSGDYVGGPCGDERDCSSGECVRGGDFPDGMCTVSCREDADCPAGTACIDREGGICALLCDFDADCRRGYDCSDVSRRGHSGNATVCIDD